MSQDPYSKKDVPTRKTIKWEMFLGFGIVAVASLIYVPSIASFLGPISVLSIYDLIVVVSALFAAFLAASLWRAHERGEILSVIWGNITVGLILWAAGEIIWSTDQIWGGNSLPYPSLADFVWILGYVPLILAFGLRVHTLKISPNKWWQYAVLSIYLLLFILAIWFILTPIFSDPETARVYEKTINLLYPIGDLLLGLIAVYLVLILIGGTLFNSWGLIALGFFCAAASDLLYALAIWQGTFQANPADGLDLGSFTINVLYVAFYVLVATGLYRQAKSIKAV